MKKTLEVFKRVLYISILLMGFTSIEAQSFHNLFDGKTLNGWKILAGQAEFKVENGSIVGITVPNSGNTFLVTQKDYGDFILELDVKIESPKSNSGIQTRSHYDPTGNQGRGKVYGRQCEIDPSSRKWSGGIYDEGRRDWLYPMDLHADAMNAFKLGEFNHYRVECIGDEMRTWINGIPMACVVDTLDKKGFIGLQVHAIGSAEDAGKKIFFKNIQIQTENLQFKPFPPNIYVVNLRPNKLSEYEERNGWKLLYDGKSSKGWVSATSQTFPDHGWDYSNNTLHVLPSFGKEESGGGDIVTDSLFGSFDLSFQFKLTPGANSGVKYFVTLTEQTKGSAIGLEYQVLDDALHPDAKLGKNGDRTLASLYDLIPSKKQERFIRPIGAWNSGRIVVLPNNHVEHYLNGIKVLEYDRGSQDYRERVAQSKFVIWKNYGEAAKGHILLQDHGNEVYFRNIKIKTLFP